MSGILGENGGKWWWYTIHLQIQNGGRRYWNDAELGWSHSCNISRLSKQGSATRSSCHIIMSLGLINKSPEQCVLFGRGLFRRYTERTNAIFAPVWLSIWISIYVLVRRSYQEEDQCFLEALVRQEKEERGIVTSRKEKARADATWMKQVALPLSTSQYLSI